MQVMKLLDIFKDDNTINEKAVIGMIAFCVMVIVMLADIIFGFFGKPFQVNPLIYNSFLYLVLGCFGIAGAEKIFAKKSKRDE